ncbi:hypothetical protein V0M98_37710 (plasmid) [Pseudomonas silesiensis]|uniref:hypothetical protein n=1 Tax=Pseudomonas silesiensis TaxID=1853130 RepID=UPI0030D33799
MSTWKSKIFETLGVTSVASVNHGPSGVAKGMLLAATVVAGLGAMSPAHAYDNSQHEGLGETYAQKQAHKVKEEPSTLSKVYNTVLNADSLLLNTALDQVIDVQQLQPPEGSIPEDLDDTKSPFMHATGIAMSGVAAAAAAPAMGAWIMIKQADRTVQFIKDKEAADLTQKMTDVERRTARIYDETVLASRTEDLRKQGIENPTMDDFYVQEQRYQESKAQLLSTDAQRIMDDGMDNFGKEMDQKGSVSAAAFDGPEVPSSTANIGDLLNKGKTVERDHSSELSR